MTDRLDAPAPADLTSREIAAEQGYVDRVYRQLEVSTLAAEALAKEGHGRARLGHEGGLVERDAMVFQAAKRIATLNAAHEGLVFGRLDLKDPTEAPRYIGRIGLRDEHRDTLLIDWRAPAAAVFYQATPTEPQGVVRRRVLRCSGRAVVGVEDDLLDAEAGDELPVIGEGALIAQLSRARDRTMHSIVATIQAEQDRAIRAPSKGVVEISGGPGTGKTVVALHRAAYLLYSNRRRFTSGGVLVVGPSRVFMNYIERVLPSLGEESVTLRPVGAVAGDVVRLAGERVDDAPTAAVKGSLRMVRVLRRLVQEPPQAVPLELRLTLRGHVLVLRVEALERIRSEVLAHHKLNAGREAAEKALLQALWRGRPAELDLEREEFDDAVTDTAAFTMFLLAWWPGVSAPTALARLGDRALLARLAGSTLTSAEQDLVAASYPRAADLPRTADWTVADAALLDELVNLLGPVPESEDREETLFLPEDAEYAEVVTTADRLTPAREVDPFAEPHQTYSHVLVDEAQDVTPMQWRMLRRRGAGASWTIVGDPAQSSWPDPAETDRALKELVGTAPVRRFRMSTNYRSPAEVFDLAASVVVQDFPDADLPRAVRSTGVEPLLLVADERGVPACAVEAVTDLLDQVEGTVGVICAPGGRDAVRSALDAAALPGAERLAVVTSLESKGLEYDGVLVVEPDRIVAESPGGVRSLYVALTRPTQLLVTLDAAGAGPAGWRRSRG